jgi:L-asparaginase II
MLTLNQKMGADPSYYTELRHPVQQLCLQSVSEFTGVDKEDIPLYRWLWCAGAWIKCL